MTLDQIIKEGSGANQFISIVAAAYDKAGETIPRFVGRANVTSDGYLMCDFVTRDGGHKHGAFFGAVSDLWENERRFVEHFKLAPAVAKELHAKLQAWIATDWRQ